MRIREISIDFSLQKDGTVKRSVMKKSYRILEELCQRSTESLQEFVNEQRSSALLDHLLQTLMKSQSVLKGVRSSFCSSVPSFDLFLVVFSLNFVVSRIFCKCPRIRTSLASNKLFHRSFNVYMRSTVEHDTMLIFSSFNLLDFGHRSVNNRSSVDRSTRDV